MTEMQIRRIHKQHGTLVVSIPKPVARAMEAKRGSYIIFKQIDTLGVFVIAKVHEGDYPYGDVNRDPDKQNKGGGT